MGLSVDTVGRLLLPAEREADALAATLRLVAAHEGWFDPDDDQWPVTSLDDLAPVAGVRLGRDGDWLLLATDEEGDPTWSDQATASYAGLAAWVVEGQVHVTGEDGGSWSYAVVDGRLVQHGVNGWDGSTEPFGAPAEPSGGPVTGSLDQPRRRGWFGRR